MIDDEGVRLGLATEIDFVGAGVTATIAGSIVTVNIPGAGLSALSINNTVFVDKTYGNDATGVCERMDKPFLTVAAARTAAIAFFVAGDAPSATNRVLMKLQPGLYSEQILLRNFFDWDLTNSVITSAVDTISDNGGQLNVNSIIYGNANITSTDAAVVSIRGEGSFVRLFCDVLTGQGASSSVIVEASTLIIDTRSITSVSESCVQLTSGTLTINSCTAARGSTAGTGSNCVRAAAGNLTLNDCIVSSSLNSSVVCTNTSAANTKYNSTRIVATGTNSSGISDTAGVGTTVLKNVTIIATGTGASIVAGSTVKIYGACEANLPVGAGVTTQVGLITIDSNVI